MSQPQIQIEELDSLPIILSLLKKMEIIGLIDATFIPHKKMERALSWRDSRHLAQLYYCPS